MHGDEASGQSRRREPLHLSLSSAGPLMVNFGPVILAPSAFVARRQAHLAECRAIRGQLVGRDLHVSNALLLEEFPSAVIERAAWLSKAEGDLDQRAGPGQGETNSLPFPDRQKRFPVPSRREFGPKC
jgi:hypothetical protein